MRSSLGKGGNTIDGQREEGRIKSSVLTDVQHVQGIWDGGMAHRWLTPCRTSSLTSFRLPRLSFPPRQRDAESSGHDPDYGDSPGAGDVGDAETCPPRNALLVGQPQ